MEVYVQHMQCRKDVEQL